MEKEKGTTITREGRLTERKKAIELLKKLKKEEAELAKKGMLNTTVSEDKKTVYIKKKR